MEAVDRVTIHSREMWNGWSIELFSTTPHKNTILQICLKTQDGQIVMQTQFGLIFPQETVKEIHVTTLVHSSTSLLNHPSGVSCLHNLQKKNVGFFMKTVVLRINLTHTLLECVSRSKINDNMPSDW
jgi:hypothetical protein